MLSFIVHWLLVGLLKKSNDGGKFGNSGDLNFPSGKNVFFQAEPKAFPEMLCASGCTQDGPRAAILDFVINLTRFYRLHKDLKGETL